MGHNPNDCRPYEEGHLDTETVTEGRRCEETQGDDGIREPRGELGRSLLPGPQEELTLQVPQLLVYRTVRQKCVVQASRLWHFVAVALAAHQSREY